MYVIYIYIYIYIYACIHNVYIASHIPGPKGNDKGSPSQSKKRETTKKKKTDPPVIHIHRQGSLLFLLQGV